MRSAPLVFAVAVLVSIVGAAVTAGGDKRDFVQSTGVIITTPIARLAPGETACQRRLVTYDEVASMRFHPAEIAAPTEIGIEVRDDRNGRVLARDRVQRNGEGGAPETASFDAKVPAERRIAVCFENIGPGGLDLYGDDGITSQCVLAPGSVPCVYKLPHPLNSTSDLVVAGEPTAGTISFSLHRAEPEALLGGVSEIFDRASTFRPGFVGEVLWWIVLALVVLGAPAAIWWALGGVRTAVRD